MKKIINPLQNWLFDPFEVVLSTQAVTILGASPRGILDYLIPKFTNGEASFEVSLILK